VPGGDALEECRLLELEAVWRLAANRLTLRPRRGVRPQEQRPVRHEAAGPEAVHVRDLVDPEAPARSLIRERRIHEAVEEHPDPGRQQRLHALLDELGPRGRIQQRLRTGTDRQPRLLHERPDPLRQLVKEPGLTVGARAEALLYA